MVQEAIRESSALPLYLQLPNSPKFLLGVAMIGPWACLVIYDLFLYIVRSITYEIPFVGGRARGKARPRAPSLTERPSGHRRKFSLARRRDLSSYDSATGTADEADSYWRIQEENDDHIAKSAG